MFNSDQKTGATVNDFNSYLDYLSHSNMPLRACGSAQNLTAATGNSNIKINTGPSEYADVGTGIIGNEQNPQLINGGED